MFKASLARNRIDGILAVSAVVDPDVLNSFDLNDVGDLSNWNLEDWWCALEGERWYIFV